MQNTGNEFTHERNNTFSAICDILECENNIPAWPDKFGMSVKKWLLENEKAPIKTLSLFTGAGGLDIGFSDVGFDIVESIEIEQKFCETLRMNTGKGKYFSGTKVNCIDIREFTARDIGRIDFVIGGPPCQTFSAAGRRANGVLGVSDERGRLFREYVRILKEVNPVGFLFENVYGIIGAQKGEAWKEICEAFSLIGYNLFYRIVDAADFGVPQHRERLLIVGLKHGTFKFPRPTHGPDSVDNASFYNAETAIEGVVSRESDSSNKLGGRYADLLYDIPPGLNYSFYTEEMGHPNPIFAWRSKFSDFLYKADPNNPVRTIKASGGAYTGPLHWDNRFFNYEEYKRLQTFPDAYNISGSKQIAVKQIGNSVPPQLARIMAIAIRQQVFKTTFPFELPLLEDNEKLSFRRRKRELTDIYRKKAELAIKSLKNNACVLPDSREYYCSINQCFRYREVPSSVGEFYVCVKWHKNLTIDVYDAADRNHESTIEIIVSPRTKVWTLNVSSVTLRVHSSSRMGFTVAWKAFEQELITNNIKADLIQLSGYYQYTPKFESKCTIMDSVPYASTLCQVIQHHTIPEIKTTEQLADDWCISAKDVLSVAKYLRSLGFEIRNQNTNPQINKNCWLVPYSFPTLTPLSVQLGKNLD